MKEYDIFYIDNMAVIFFSKLIKNFVNLFETDFEIYEISEIS